MVVKLIGSDCANNILHVNPHQIVSAYKMGTKYYIDLSNNETHETTLDCYGRITKWMEKQS